MSGMLGHIRVLDATGDLGLFAGRMLAGLGATVTRFESVDQLAAADILLRTGPVAGLDHAACPRLIDVLLTAFDAEGANRDRPFADLTLMARSGLATIVGDPDRAPLKLPGEQAYALAGIQATTAALVALQARATSGRGQLVRVSALQSAVLANYREPLTWAWTGRIGARTGNLLVRGKSGVRQVWPAADGWVTWSIVDNPAMMRAMVAAMAAEDCAGPLGEVDWDAILVADMPRETLIAWEELVADYFARHSRAELAALSTANGLGLSPIDEVEDVLASPQLAARNFWHIREDGVRVPGPLFQTSETPS
jgi:crotonobetainyl-CoA:carnitine CoA-transferase CaiB-like acyl-CoA transferase